MSMPHIEDFKVCPCMFCNGTTDNWNPWCYGCGLWVTSWRFNGLTYCGPFDVESGRIRPWRGQPTTEMVVEDLGRWAIEVARILGDNAAS